MKTDLILERVLAVAVTMSITKTGIQVLSHKYYSAINQYTCLRNSISRNILHKLFNILNTDRLGKIIALSDIALI